jgi:methionyl-tRNA formyltransferase
MRVIFCGNPDFAVPTLDALLDSDHSVVGVVCSPDKPRGRGRKISALPVEECAQKVGLPVMQPASLKDPEFLDRVRALQPDCLVVVAFRILPRELFGLPRLGSFNVHPSLLPKGRGPAPIRWTLIRGESETGVSIIHLTETVDGGDILAQERTNVLPDEDFGSLHARLARIGARMLVATLDAFETANPPRPLVQNESLVTKAPKLKPEDFVLDWSLTAEDLSNRIRAFSPSPGAATQWNGTRFKILSASLLPDHSQLEPGQVLREGEGNLMVGTGKGALRLIVVQPEGKRAMTVSEFLRGRPSIPAVLGK